MLYIKFSGKQIVSQRVEGTFLKSFCHALENVNNCLAVLPMILLVVFKR